MSGETVGDARAVVEPVAAGPALTSAADFSAFVAGGPVRLFVPAFGRDVFLLSPTALIRDEWEKFVVPAKKDTAADGSPPWRAKAAQLLLCDESGKRLFKDADVPFLSTLNPDAMTTIFLKAVQLLAVTEEEVRAVAGE